ncbi:MAG: AAA family ATPase [Cyanobacteria bacterium REEB446]|nr:AAA family ATPase [Cyanobacteria bacterium REEB446]
MIKKIKMNGVACFASDSSIEIELAKNNLFYGLNGSGKTTISRFLDYGNKDNFKNCTVEPDLFQNQDFKIFVYNEDFIQKNFLSSNTLDGVFTLGEDNVEAEKTIQAAQNSLRIIEAEKEKKLEDKRLLQEDFNKKKGQIKDDIFRSKKIIERKHRELYELLESKNSKETFYEKVSNTQRSENIVKDFKELNEEAGLLATSDNVHKKKLELISQEISNELAQIDSSSLFQEIIQASGDSYLQDLIKKLQNSDWVRQGLDKYLASSEKKCPFCQQKIDLSIHQELEKVFDQVYTSKIQDLRGHLEQYKKNNDEILRLIDVSEKSNPDLQQVPSYLTAKDRLEKALSKNISILQEKIVSPHQSLAMQSLENLIKDFNKELSNQNQRINNFNESISNRSEKRKELIICLWQTIRNEHDSEIQSFNKEEQEYKGKDSQLSSKIKELDNQIQQKKRIIEDNQNKITSITPSIKSINNKLESSGIQGFEITEYSFNHYKIVRDNDSNDQSVFKTLSEGEKTLISFLYFLELIKGNIKNQSQIDSSKRIIVIDDPISSLSHNLIYEIGCLIKKEVLKNDFAQVIIFTHSLFFFHEFTKRDQKDNKCNKYFRVAKDSFTKITEISSRQIRNHYEDYWFTLREYKKTNCQSVLIPNAIRNILEYFRDFVRLEDWSGKIPDSLNRLIDRESHSDDVNIYGFRDTDYDKLLEDFEDVFKKIGHEPHFISMMGDSLN